MKIAIVGYGRMGREVERLAPEMGHEIVAVFDEYSPLEESSPLLGAEVLVDFSLASAVRDVLRVAALKEVPVVEGTTGWNHLLREVQSIKGLTMIYSPNFSIGVYRFTQLVREAARLLGPMGCYDTYVHDWHHSGKVDSPSGTAARLAEVIISELEDKTVPLYESCHRRIEPNELHVTSTRVGRLPGTHEVGFDSEYDQILLKHVAQGRAGLAFGALRAAEWIVGREGIFTMDDWMREKDERAARSQNG
jgi:4-hydroxy-tetrahydrodipicolinate reductase